MEKGTVINIALSLVRLRYFAVIFLIH